MSFGEGMRLGGVGWGWGQNVIGREGHSEFEEECGWVGWGQNVIGREGHSEFGEEWGGGDKM